MLRRLDGISQKVLTQTLRDLERHGLLLREDLRTVPPHVRYRLSELGRSLNVALLALDRWAETHHQELQAAAGTTPGRRRTRPPRPRLKRRATLRKLSLFRTEQ